MKKIILSLAIVGIVGAVAIGGTIAYFSDTETSTGNTFTAGTLDLKTYTNDWANPIYVDSPLTVHITRGDLKPYAAWSHNYGGQWVLKNTGSIPGTFSMKIVNVKNYENGCLDMETDAGDVTCVAGTDQGELGNLLWVKWSRNQIPWGGWGTKMTPLNSAEGVVVTGDVLNPGETRNVLLDIEWDTHAGTQDNLGQGDSIEFDIEFRLNQSPIAE